MVGLGVEAADTGREAAVLPDQGDRGGGCRWMLGSGDGGGGGLAGLVHHGGLAAGFPGWADRGAGYRCVGGSGGGGGGELACLEAGGPGPTAGSLWAAETSGELGGSGGSRGLGWGCGGLLYCLHKKDRECSFTLQRSEEHTSERQSQTSISDAVFCLKKKK